MYVGDNLIKEFYKICYYLLSMIKKLYFGLVLIPVLSSISGNKGVDCQTISCEEKLLVS